MAEPYKITGSSVCHQCDTATPVTSLENGVCGEEANFISRTRKFLRRDSRHGRRSLQPPN